MFGIGEILVIVSIGVLVISARRLPELIGSLGSSVKSFKKGLKGEEDPRPMRDVGPPDDSRRE